MKEQWSSWLRKADDWILQRTELRTLLLGTLIACSIPYEIWRYYSFRKREQELFLISGGIPYPESWGLARITGLIFAFSAILILLLSFCVKKKKGEVLLIGAYVLIAFGFAAPFFPGAGADTFFYASLMFWELFCIRKAEKRSEVKEPQ